MAMFLFSDVARDAKSECMRLGLITCRIVKISARELQPRRSARRSSGSASATSIDGSGRFVVLHLPFQVGSRRRTKLLGPKPHNTGNTGLVWQLYFACKDTCGPGWDRTSDLPRVKRTLSH